MTSGKNSEEPHAPLTAALFQVLLSLADGEKHGYAILKDIETQSMGKTRMGAGTLYGIIKRLLNDGMIVECQCRPAKKDDDARRRYYELTGRGRQVVVAEVERMKEMLSIARDKRLLKKWMTI
jgi:DNA-binding PadR family transcriptional regulator